MLAMDELAVRECIGPCPVLGDAEVAVCVEVEEVEALREQDDLGDRRRLGVGSKDFWSSISRT